jgi:hypothetical protein
MGPAVRDALSRPVAWGWAKTGLGNLPADIKRASAADKTSLHDIVDLLVVTSPALIPSLTAVAV